MSFELKHAGALDTRWQRPDVWTPCTYVNEGERVLVNIGESRGVLATVRKAAGFHAQVELDRGGLRWVNVTDCARRTS